MIATVAAAASRHHHSKEEESTMKNCCFCFDLRTGSLIICGLGFFEAFGTIGPFGWLTTLLALISCGCLLYGILKERSEFFRPYIFEQGMAIVFAFGGLILMATQSSARIEFTEHFAGQVDESDMAILYFVSLSTVFAFLVFKVYLLIVVYALYKELILQQILAYPMTLTTPPLQNVIVIDDNRMKFSRN